MVSGGYPDSLSANHITMVPFLAQPLTNAQVVECLRVMGYQISENRVSILRNSPLMQRFVENYKLHMAHNMAKSAAITAHEKLDSMVDQAVTELDGLLTGAESESVRMKAIQTTLDYSPNGPKQVKQVESTQRTEIAIDEATLSTIEKALKATDQFFGGEEPIDVTPSPAKIMPDENTPLEAPELPQWGPDPNMSPNTPPILGLPGPLPPEDEASKVDQDLGPSRKPGPPVLKSITGLTKSLGLEDEF